MVYDGHHQQHGSTVSSAITLSKLGNANVAELQLYQKVKDRDAAHASVSKEAASGANQYTWSFKVTLLFNSQP